MSDSVKLRVVLAMVVLTAIAVVAIVIVSRVQRGDVGDEVAQTPGTSAPVAVAAVTPSSQGVVAAATKTSGAASPQTMGLAGDLAVGESGIWVSGTGQTTMDPDLAVLQLGVEAFEQTVAEANTVAANAMDSIMEALRSNGVADRDLQTHSYNVRPQYEWVEATENGRRVNKQNLIGYTVVNNLKAKVRDLDAAGDLIDEVVVAGGDATTFHGLQFTVEDASDVMEQLREDAVLDAMAKAQHIADTAGVALGSLGYITDQPVRTFSTFDAPMARAEGMALTSAAASTPNSGANWRCR